MKRILAGSALAAATIALMLPASAPAGLGFTVQEGFASPTVVLGSAMATKLCEVGRQETRLAPWPDGVPPPITPLRPPPPCSRQDGVRPLVVGRARAARVTLRRVRPRRRPAGLLHARDAPGLEPVDPHPD